MVSCSKCGRGAVVELPYASLDLCKRCFVKQFEQRVGRVVRSYGMLEKGDCVVVGVSGGKDSASLLSILAAWAPKHRIEVIPLLIDEGIEGYRNKAIERARELCKSLGLRLEVRSFKKEFGLTLDEIIKNRNKSRENNCAKEGDGACTYCGVLRRTLLNRGARELRATKLAIAHNLDDVAQTFLMNLMRHHSQALERFDVATSEQEGFVPRIRPMFYNSERECALYATLNALPFHLGECPYAKESFRVLVRNHLNEIEAVKRGTKYALLQSWLELKKRFNGMKKEKLVKCSECGDPSATKACKTCELLAKLR